MESNNRTLQNLVIEAAKNYIRQHRVRVLAEIEIGHEMPKRWGEKRRAIAISQNNRVVNAREEDRRAFLTLENAVEALKTSEKYNNG